MQENKQYLVTFEDFVEQANKATTRNELFQIYSRTIQTYGLDKVLFCCVSDHRDVNVMPEERFKHNYPNDWMSYYFEHGYDKIDPVPLYGINKAEGYFWEEIPPNMMLNKDQEKCLIYGEEAGLYNGISIPLRGPNNALAGVSLASSEKRDSFDTIELHRDLLTAFSNHLYICFRRLCEHQDNQPVKNYVLSDKERDILSWAARGKTDYEIGIILGISNHTVDWHMRNIFKKLEANHRVLAIVKAISYGLIQP